MLDYVRLKISIHPIYIKTELWKRYEYPNRWGVMMPWYRTNIRKIKLSYSVENQTMYIYGRIINLITENSYMNFDDLGNFELVRDHFIKKANALISSKLKDYNFDILKTTVTQIEYSYNINFKNKDKYIEFLNLIYIKNIDGKFKKYKDFTVQNSKEINSSFYLKTNGDYDKNTLINFCLNIYNKSVQMNDKHDKNIVNYHKSNIKTEDIAKAKNILRIECKVGYEYLHKICKTFKIKNSFDNLFNTTIAQYAICHQLKRFFGTGDFYSKKTAEKIIADNNLKINLDIPISELSEYKYKKFRKELEKLGICPYGFIPEEWGISKMDNPIKLILNKDKVLQPSGTERKNYDQ